MDDVLDTLKNAWKSERLTYREIDPKDEDVRKWIHSENVNNPAVAAFQSESLLKPRQMKYTESMLENFAKSLFPVTIVLPGDEGDETIGIIRLAASENLDLQHHRSAMMGIFIAPKFQNNGYGTEASRWIVNYGFRFLNLHSITLGVYSFNERAQKVYQKIGFQREGCLRERYFLNKKWYDIIEMSILEHDWEEICKQRAVSL